APVGRYRRADALTHPALGQAGPRLGAVAGDADAAGRAGGYVPDEDVAARVLGIAEPADHVRRLQVGGRRLEGHQRAVAADDRSGARPVGLCVVGADIDPDRQVCLAIGDETVGDPVGVTV